MKRIGNPSNTNNNIGFRAVLPANTEKGPLANAHSRSRFAGRKQHFPFGAGTKMERPGRAQFT